MTFEYKPLELEPFNNAMVSKKRNLHKRSDSISLDNNTNFWGSSDGVPRGSICSTTTTPPGSPSSSEASGPTKAGVVDLDQITYESERFKRRLSEGNTSNRGYGKNYTFKEVIDHKTDFPTEIKFRHPFKNFGECEGEDNDWKVYTASGKMQQIRESEMIPKKLSAYDFLNQEPNNAHLSTVASEVSTTSTLPSSSEDYIKQYQKKNSKVNSSKPQRLEFKKMPSMIKKFLF